MSSLVVTWLGIAAAMSAFLLLLVALQAYARAVTVQPETTRKLLHAGSGLLTLPFPFLFHEVWPVLLLTVASALVLAAARFVPAVRARLGGVAGRVARRTFGEFYFPLSVAILFTVTREAQPLLFVIPVLVLSLADAASAAIGGRYGLTRRAGTGKSLEGSTAFAVVAFLCVHVPLSASGMVDGVQSLLISATLALLVTLLESIAGRGRDNLLIPLGSYGLLHGLLGLDTAALVSWLTVTLSVVLLAVLHLCACSDGRDHRRLAVR